MAEQIIQPDQTIAAEPALRRNEAEPQGVMRKHMKVLVFLGACAVVSAAAIVSSYSKEPSEHSRAAQHDTPQPALVDNTDNNVQDLKNQLAAERQREAQLAASNNAGMGNGTAGMPQISGGNATTSQPGVCLPGQPCPQQGAYAQPQISPEEQQAQLLAAKERELAYNARFASNLVYTNSGNTPAESRSSTTAHMDSNGPTSVSQSSAENGATSLIGPQMGPEQKGTPADDSQVKRKAEVNIDSASGQPYVLYEGLTVDTILMNRLDGDAPGPVKVMVSSPVYSHDRQHVLIPDGTVVLGEARKIGSAGFGQQRRMAVVFHRMIMPDGYSVDLDQFHGLDQIGEEGAKDRVDNHYLQVFGTSIALGVISAAGEIAAGGGTITTSGSQAFTTGAASNMSQSATTVLDRFIQIPPTITIREGHRIKVYFTQDLLLPAYENHTIPQTF